jgi:hypothetical protein
VHASNAGRRSGAKNIYVLNTELLGENAIWKIEL